MKGKHTTTTIAIFKRITKGELPNPKESRLNLFPDIEEAKSVITSDVEETIHQLLESAASFEVDRDATHTRIDSGDKTVEWMISADVEGASDAEHAVVRTYSWDTSPDLVATTLFEQEGDAIADLAEWYNSEKASDQASGYAFDASIEANARWAKITNYRASGDIDHTLWMRLPVTTTLA